MSQTNGGSRDTLDPRVRRTRRLLLDGFRALMGERSYARITVGDVAARATVNRATFYLHFRDKDALLDELLREWTQEALDRAAPVPSRRDPDYLKALLVGVCEFLAHLERQCPRSHRQSAARLEALAQAAVRARVAAWLALPGGSSYARAEPLRATVISAGVYAAAKAWQHDERRSTAQAFARRVIPVLLAPLGESDEAAPSAGRRRKLGRAGMARASVA